MAKRNFLKRKLFSTINLIGLTLGLSSFLLIVLYVADEFSYDSFHRNAGRIYRVYKNVRFEGKDKYSPLTPAPLGRALAADFPEVEKFVRLFKINELVATYGDNTTEIPVAFHADSTFLEVFSYELLAGDQATLLDQPNTLVVTEQLARLLFKNEVGTDGAFRPGTALGKVLLMGSEKTPYTVKGVLKQPPHNSHFHFDAVLSVQAFDYANNSNWLANDFYSYVLLKDGASAQALQAKLPSLVHKYVGPLLQQQVGISPHEMVRKGNRWEYFIQPVTDIHLHSHMGYELEVNSDPAYLYILIVISLFIIVIACVNYVNLSTARFIARVKEVSIRKALGSSRGQLVGQFMLASFGTVLIAVCIGLLITALVLPTFSRLSGKALTAGVYTEPWFVGGMVLLTWFIALVAGSYPAFYFTSFNPVQGLKGEIKAGPRGRRIRSTLVVFQFAISIGLIVCTILVYEQITFMRKKNLGFTKDNVLVIENLDRLGPHQEAFKQALQQMTQVAQASIASSIPASPEAGRSTFRRAGTQENFLTQWSYADYDYLSALNVKLAAGRSFSKDFASDTAAVLLNEAAVRQFGLSDPLNQYLEWEEGSAKRLKIVGVFRNYHFESLHNEIKPFLILLSRQGNYIIAHLRSNDWEQTLGTIQGTWKKFSSGTPFEYSFLDQNFDALSTAEIRMGKIFGTFTGLAILISCLGLVGLATFMAEQRTKEIAVHKVLGASVTNVAVLLSKDFFYLILIALVIASPLAWWGMHEWLSTFAYRTRIDWWTFPAAGAIAILVTLLTMSYQVVKAASINLVKGLRND